jgi:AraC-like DNA-binding protein
MQYGDEYYREVPSGFELEKVPAEQLVHLFADARRVTWFGETPDGGFTMDASDPNFGQSCCFRLDADNLFEINDSFLRVPTVLHNTVADLISFQFVSTVKRTELLGGRRNVHNLGPAIIVTAVPGTEITYRMPRIHEPIRHVVVYTTLSSLLQRMAEPERDYPNWFREILNGDFAQPRQRVLFLEGVHRDLIWPCFNLPVSGNLLKHWLTAKYFELLSIGLQILKNNQAFIKAHPASSPVVGSEKIRSAETLLNREYANPPSLPALAKHLGISETQLKSGFKAINGVSVRQYCINRRIDAAKLLLLENRHSISEISDIVGYQDHSAFSRAFRRRAGCSPRQWQQANG